MPVRISTASGSPPEEATRAQLERLPQRYDLSPWTFTEEVMIQEGAIPHSHPTLTLSTRHLDDDGLLLSTYLHEQLHWRMGTVRERAWAAVEDFATRYPDLPTDLPQGSGDKIGTYFHLIICPLEIASVLALAGEDEARRVLDFWCGDHYTAIYRIVRDDASNVAAVLARHDLTLEWVLER